MLIIYYANYYIRIALLGKVTTFSAHAQTQSQTQSALCFVLLSFVIPSCYIIITFLIKVSFPLCADFPEPIPRQHRDFMQDMPKSFCYVFSCIPNTMSVTRICGQ